MISSKDDPTTASLLGFAIANRVEPNSATMAGDSKERYSKGEHNDAKEAKSRQEKEQTAHVGKNAKDGKD